MKHDHNSGIIYLMHGTYGDLPITSYDVNTGELKKIPQSGDEKISEFLTCVYNNARLFHYANCERDGSGTFYRNTWYVCYTVGAWKQAVIDGVQTCKGLLK